MTNSYGGRNDRALWMVQESGLKDAFWLRAEEDTGDIVVTLQCNDIFVWGCADCEILPDELWDEFEKSVEAAEDHFDEDDLHWIAPAWAVKLRGVAPQKPATDRSPKFVEMLDWLNVPWREMERYDQMAEKKAAEQK